MILTTPLFNALRWIFPGAHISVIAAETSMIIPRHHPSVNDVIPVTHGLMRLPRLISELRGKRFDLYIDPKDHRSTTSRVIADLIDARFTMGHPSNAGWQPFRAELPPAEDPRHYIDRMLAPIRYFADDYHPSRRPTLGIPDDMMRRIDQQLRPGDNGIVSVNISAGDKSRYWGLENWERIVQELSRRYSVAVLSTPHDRYHADEICAMRREAQPIRTDNILEAAAVVSRSRLVVSADTSIVHLASVSNTPIVGLYPPVQENARTFAPLSAKQRVIMPPPGREFTGISQEEVLRAIGEILPL